MGVRAGRAVRRQVSLQGWRRARAPEQEDDGQEPLTWPDLVVDHLMDRGRVRQRVEEPVRALVWMHRGIPDAETAAARLDLSRQALRRRLTRAGLPGVRSILGLGSAAAAGQLIAMRAFSGVEAAEWLRWRSPSTLSNHLETYTGWRFRNLVRLSEDGWARIADQWWQTRGGVT